MEAILPGAKKQGFTLIELMISVALIAVAILMAVGIFMTLLRSSQKSADRSAGAVLAGSVLSDEIYSIFDGTHPTLSKAAFFSSDSPPGAPLQGTLNQNGTLFTYSISYSTLQDVSGGGGTVGDVLGNNRVKRANIVVWWWTPTANGQRSGYGYLRTTLSRLINERQEF